MNAIGAGMAIRVGAYDRISDDGEDERAGVERQWQDNQATARVRRWEVVRYSDNDISAFKRRVKRPAFEQMLKDLEAGVIQGVVVWDLDRFARQPIDLERAIAIYEENANLVMASVQGDINLHTSDGRTMARVMVAFANKASADTGRRVMRKQQELAAAGKAHGGRQPFGWLEDGKTVDPVAQAEINKAHDAILERNAKITEIRDDWVKRGIHPTNRAGKRFKGATQLHHKTVKRILTNPALAGIKVYKGEVVTGENGKPIEAEWDKVTTPERLAAVTAVLEGRSNAPKGTNALKYLLSGIARCGVCSRPMRGQMRRRANGTQYPVYLCDASGYAGGCGKVSRVAEPIEKLIIPLVLADQERKKAQQKADVPAWEGEEELTQVQADITELLNARKAGAISMSTLIALMPDLEAKRDNMQRDRARYLAELSKNQFLSASSLDEFDALELEDQRDLIRKSLSAVIVHPQGKGIVKFNPDLIEPVWAN
jgi:site-specific DNA recombinase